MGRLGDLTALRADGVEFPIEASISQARVDGELLFTVILRDMSERRAAMETQRLLIGELDHRVKNTLAMVQAIANQTAKSYVGSQGFCGKFQRARARHGQRPQLADARGMDGRRSGGPYPRTADPGSGPPYHPSRRQCFSRAANRHAFRHGLVRTGANARKYGALSRNEGRLDLQWSVDDLHNARQLSFDWVESGGPPAKPPAEKHFGTRLIKSSLTHSLHGTVELDFAPAGLRCKINLPLRPSLA